MFLIIIDMLEAAFNSPVSERDYHDIVRCIREYGGSRDDHTNERAVLTAKGWPESYDVCEQVEAIRYAMVFGTVDNARVQAAVAEWDRCPQRNNASPAVAYPLVL